MWIPIESSARSRIVMARILSWIPRFTLSSFGPLGNRVWNYVMHLWDSVLS
jgi:hypothetical protein